jgi:hypothetical protein
VRGHEARFRTLFQRLLVLSLGVPGAVQACSGNGAQAPADAGGVDATLPRDSAAEGSLPDDATSGGEDATLDTSTAVSADAGGADGDASQAVADDGGDGGEEAAVDAGPPFPGCNDATSGAPYTTEAGGACAYYIDFSCALNAYAPPHGSCTPPAEVCLSVCTLDAGALFGCDYEFPACSPAGFWLADAGEAVTMRCELCPGIGRRPARLRAARETPSSSALGAYFARASYLEAASVFAFERLARELGAHGAPDDLVHGARRSEVDEVRHARMTARIARRHGGEVPRARVRRGANRSLASVALENAVEGCVRETFGAMVATWQAAHARDADVKRCMERIAADETRHAALAWAVAEWADTALDARARACVARAREAAVRGLERELDLLPAGDVARRAGLPTRSQARAIMRHLEGEVWRADTRPPSS